MITIENLTKTFGKKKALDNLSVTLEPGVIGLLGPCLLYTSRCV